MSVKLEGQCITQVGKISTCCFKSRANKTLSKIENQPVSLIIGCIRLGGIMVADDLAVISKSSDRLQQLVFEAQEDASRKRYTYNVTIAKSQVVGINKQILKAKEDI